MKKTNPISNLAAFLILENQQQQETEKHHTNISAYGKQAQSSPKISILAKQNRDISCHIKEIHTGVSKISSEENVVSILKTDSSEDIGTSEIPYGHLFPGIQQHQHVYEMTPNPRFSDPVPDLQQTPLLDHS
jgi:hypothetical protein